MEQRVHNDSLVSMSDVTEKVNFIFDNKNGTSTVHYKNGMKEVIKSNEADGLAKILKERQSQINKFNKENGVLDTELSKAEVSRYGKTV